MFYLILFFIIYFLFEQKGEEVEWRGGVVEWDCCATSSQLYNILLIVLKCCATNEHIIVALQKYLMKLDRIIKEKILKTCLNAIIPVYIVYSKV
jgi:hypothetical protein